MPEPKIEPWMTAAAEEIEALSDVLYGAESMMAAIIARHAPDPASVPIGPGDVVQVVSEAHARSWLGIVREKYDNGKWFVVGYGCADTHELTRIGRAKYWPDGSKVEEGK
jgi:hypothetical protein